MCNIAGYTGNRRAAPILIEMLRREQYFDGGICTGIATIHEGKLYHTKVVGNVDELLSKTDALSFPGTVGIAHSRPLGNFLASQAHPFIDADEQLALVLNGVLSDVDTPEFVQLSHDIMQGFLDRSFPIRSAIEKSGKRLPLSNGLTYHGTEPYALMAGDNYKQGMPLHEALGTALDTLPGDIVTLAIHVNEPGTIALGRVCRPMCVGLGDGETFLATSALAFPEDVPLRNVLSAPTTSVSLVTPGGFAVTPFCFRNVSIQDIDLSIWHKAYTLMENMLLGQKDNPKSFYDFPVDSNPDWKYLWKEPFVECKYRQEDGFLKPYADLCYQLLYTFHQEGRLHSVLKEHKNGLLMVHFWLE